MQKPRNIGRQINYAETGGEIRYEHPIDAHKIPARPRCYTNCFSSEQH